MGDRDFTAKGAPFLVLMGHSIEAAIPREDGTLELKLDGGMVLWLVDDRPHYEVCVVQCSKEAAVEYRICRPLSRQPLCRLGQ